MNFSKSMLLLPTLLWMLLITGFSYAEHPRNKWLTADQVEQDINLAVMTYERAHPGYARYTTLNDLTAAWEKIKTTANHQKGMRLADLYLNISEVLAMIRCDHTKAELPKTLADLRKTSPVYLPFQWQLIDNQVLVEQASKETGLVRGDQIISIDGTSIYERLEEVKKYVPVDGFTDHTKMNLIAASSEHMGGGLDHFGAMLWPYTSKVRVKYIDTSGKHQQKDFQRINYLQWQALSRTHARNFADAVEFSYINKDTAYLKIDTFVNYRSKSVKPDKLFDPVFKQLKKQATKNLILDLRENGGGSNEPPQRLLAHLMPSKFRQAKDVRVKTLNLDGIKNHVFTWEKRALNPKRSHFIQNPDGTFSFKANILDDTQWIKPDKAAFSGTLIVLTSHNNSSASTNLMTTLKSRVNTHFIGQPTGGSMEGPTAGVLLFLKLPNSGIKTRVPLFRYYNDTSDYNLGLGLTPDTLVTLNTEDFINFRDTTLDAAVKLLNHESR